MNDRTEVRLAGNGGQGLILAGIVLAEAAGLFDGRFVAQTQVYGPESRGGACRTDVIVGVVPIDYPKATAPDALLVMSEDAWTRYGASARAGGLVVYDADLVSPRPGREGRLLGLPLTHVAREELGRSIVANMVGLGALVALTGVVSRQALEAAVRGRAPHGSEELNSRALAAGWRMALQAVTASEAVR